VCQRFFSIVCFVFQLVYLFVCVCLFCLFTLFQLLGWVVLHCFVCAFVYESMCTFWVNVELVCVCVLRVLDVKRKITKRSNMRSTSNAHIYSR
jgi:hypothetical protein